MNICATRSFHRQPRALLMGLAVSVCVLTVDNRQAFTQNAAVSSSARDETEPDLTMQFKTNDDIIVEGPVYLHNRKDRETPGSNVLTLKISHGDDVLSKTVGDVNPKKLDVQLEGDGDTTLKISLPISNTDHEVVQVTVIAFGRNGRQLSKSLKVVVNAGSIVGSFVPDSLDGNPPSGELQITNVAFLNNHFEGTVLYIDSNSSGEWDPGEPTTVVDAMNKFRFPMSQEFFHERLIRPRVLWVNGKKVESDFDDHINDLKRSWFQISDLGPDAEDEDSEDGPVDDGPVDDGPVDDGPAENDSDDDAENDQDPIKAIRVLATSPGPTFDGTTWATAFPSLEDALGAVENDSDEIWIADGVYYPTNPLGFEIDSSMNAISIFAGFRGTEETRDDRPRIRRGRTILSGDIAKNDGHFAPIHAIDVTSDSQLVATASEDRTIKVWAKDGDSYKIKHTLAGHRQAVNCLAISSDGKFIVSGSDDLSIGIWNISDSTPIVKFIDPDTGDGSGHTESVRAVAISPDGSKIVSASNDGTARVWNLSTAKLIRNLRGHAGPVACVAFIDDSTVATGSEDETVRIWDIATNNPTKVLSGHQEAITSLKVIQDGPDGSPRIVSGSKDSTVRIWINQQLRDGTFEYQAENILSGENYDMQLIAVANAADIPSTGRALAILAQINSDQVQLRLFDSRGKTMIDRVLNVETVTNLRQRLAQFWNLTPAEVKSQWQDHEFNLLDRAMLQFELRDQFHDPIRKDDFGPVVGLSVTNDGKTVIVSHQAKFQPDQGNTLSFWNVEIGRLDFAHAIDEKMKLSSIAVAPNNSSNRIDNFLIFGAQTNSQVVTWGWNANSLARQSPTNIVCAAISPDGTRTAFGTIDGKLMIDDVELLNLGATVTAIAFNDDGTKLAFSTGKKLFFTDISLMPNVEDRDNAHAEEITSISISDDGNRIVTGGKDRAVKIWDSDDLTTEIHTFGGHLDDITCVDIVGQQGNGIVISGSEDGTLRVWSLKDKELKNTLQYQSGVTDCRVTENAVSPRFVVSAKRVEYEPVRLRTSGNIVLKEHQTIDGVMTVNDDRVLVTSQDEPNQNGIYIASTGLWERAKDANEPREFLASKLVTVTEGTDFAGRRAVYVGPDSPALEIDELTFIEDFAAVDLKADVNVDLNGLGTPIDGVALTENMRVLLSAQSNLNENGIYVARSETWLPALDANDSASFQQHRVVQILKGNQYGGTLDAYSSASNPVLSVDPILFVPYTSEPKMEMWRWQESLEGVPSLTRTQDLSTSDEVSQLAISNDGSTVLTGIADGSYRLWEKNASGRLRIVKSISARQNLVDLGIANDGKKFLSASSEFLRVWDRRSLQEVPSGIKQFEFGGAQQSDNATSVIHLSAGGNSVKLDGLVIQGGVSTASGGGLLTNPSSSAVLKDCIIEGNAANSGGGAHIVNGSNLHFDRCSFQWNTSQNDGGAINVLGSADFEKCVFHSNRALGNGGAIIIADMASSNLKLSTIHDCKAANGGAIENNSTITINHSNIANNHSTNSDGFAVHSGDTKNITIINSIVAANRRGADNSAGDLQSNVVNNSRSNLFGSVTEVSNADGLQSIDDSPWDELKIGEATIGLKFTVSEESPSLPIDELFDPFGDYGGIHPTLAIRDESFAIGLGLDNQVSDSRGAEYIRDHQGPDVGAFEWQPTPAARSDEFEIDNTDTEFVAIGDPRANDAPSRINSTLAISQQGLIAENPTIQFENVRLVASENITPLEGQKTIDGVLTNLGDRVLLTRQGSAESANNGIYIVSNLQWERALDANAPNELVAYKTVSVDAGNRHAGSTWTLTHNELISDPVLGTTLFQFDNSSAPTAFGQIKWNGKEIEYRIKPNLRSDDLFARDEFNYANFFGQSVSAPAPITAWVVGPREKFENSRAHRFIVNTTSDHIVPQSGSVNLSEGGLTLREALLLASHTMGDDVIEFDQTVFVDQSSKISLVAPLMVNAMGSLTIHGPGMERLVIDGGGVAQGFVVRAPKLDMSHMTIQNCVATGDSPSGAAVAVANGTEAHIHHIGFVGNAADDTGAAVFTFDSRTKIEHCTLVENQTGGSDATVISPIHFVEVKNCVLFRNYTVDDALETENYGGSNFGPEKDPRFVKQPRVIGVEPAEFGDMRLRRDSLAYRQDAESWKPDEEFEKGALIRVDAIDWTMAFECTQGGTTGAAADEPNWPTELGKTVMDNEVQWQLVEDRLRTFRFLGAYPKLPNGTDQPFGDSKDATKNVLYVDDSVLTPGDGSSWKSAIETLDGAIEKAATDYRVTTIKIAGDHRPKRTYARATSDGDGTANPDWTFVLQHGLTLQGGYRPADMLDSETTENQENERHSDPSRFPTVLSGELSTDVNAAHVFSSMGARDFVLSALTIQGASGNNAGGGLFVPSQDTNLSSGKVSKSVFHANKASAGGAIYLANGVLDVDRSMFSNNESGLNGGAISLLLDDAKLQLNNSSFTGNKAMGGGAIHVEKGKVAFDHLTIVRNHSTTTGGIAGLFLDPSIPAGNIAVSNSVISYNTNPDGDAKNSNASLDTTTNIVGSDWTHSLLPDEKFNPFQHDMSIKQGATETFAILPQIPFRLGASTKLITEGSNPRSPETETDQRGAPGISLSNSDVGAFERQYFDADDSTAPKFFVVDDQQTGMHLWAETETPQFLQLSQHIRGTDPIVRKTSVNEVEFASSGMKFKASHSDEGHVRPTTVFPAHSNELPQSDAKGNVEYTGKSDIGLTLEKIPGSDSFQLNVRDRIDGPASRQWSIKKPDNAMVTFTTPIVTLEATKGNYDIALERDGATVPMISFQVR